MRKHARRGPLRRALAWWIEDPDAAPDHRVMLGVRLGNRQGDGALTCSLLDPVPARGPVVLHAVLAPGADRARINGVLWTIARLGDRVAPGRWAAYVTDGSVYGYVEHNSRAPLIEAVAGR